MRPLRLLPLLLALLAACSSGSDGTTDPGGGGGTTGSITLSVGGGSGPTVAGGTATATVTLARLGGFAGAVSLAVSGAPAGATASVAPATLAAGATSAALTVSTSAATPAGSYPITITATGSGVSAASATYTLVVTAAPTPDFTLAATPATLALVAGGSGDVTLAITRSGGFAGAVTLQAAGLPAGAAATFAPPAPTGASATASITTTAATPPGSYPVTITGTGAGVGDRSATVTLTVTAAPTITLSSATSAVSVQQGAQSDTVAIAIARSNADGDVTFAADAPAGVSATFTPNPAGGASTGLVLAVGAGVAPGSYPIAVTGTLGALADTLTLTLTVTAPPAIGLTSATSALTVEQGSQSTALTIDIARTNADGGVAFTADVPAGVTAAFAPNPAAGANTGLTLSVGGAVTPGSYPVDVIGTLGDLADTLRLTLTVTQRPGITLASATTTASAAQGGQSGTLTIDITRTNVSGDVSFAADVPAGVSAAFAPNPAPGASTGLVFTVGGGVAPGDYPVDVVGTLGAVADTLTVTLTVTSGGGGGNEIVWPFCNADALPLFFAFQDGNGAWTRVTPEANNTYRFTLTQDRGGVTIVRAQGGGVARAEVYYYARAEFPNIAARECETNPAGKTHTGTVAGLAATVNAYVALGSATAVVPGPGTNFTLTNVPDGPQDLLAVRAALDVGTLSLTPNAMILRRNVDQANGTALAQLDFTGGEAFAPATATYTFTNTAASSFVTNVQFVSANGTVGSYTFGPLAPSAATARTVYGVPAGRLQAGDFHLVFAGTASDPNEIRFIWQYNRELANRSIPFGPALSPPTVSPLGGAPYARLRATGPWTADYDFSTGVTFSQGGDRSWTITASRGYAPGGTYTLDVPDLSAVTGWNNTWGLVGGVNTTWQVTGIGATIGAPQTAAEGTRFETATRGGTITP